MKKFLLLIFGGIMCIQGIKAQEAYAVYEDGVLTFYYDADKSLRSGVVYDLKNVEGLFPDWYFDGTRNNVTAVAFKSSFANARPTTTAGWFDSMENLTKIDGLTYLNTSAVTSMRSMFGYCKKLTSLNLESFDTRNVTSMKNMFVNCSSMLRIFHNFNTANVTDMSGMFRRCEKLKTLDLHTFSTANVTDMSYMFSGCFDLSSLSVENFNTSKVTDMSNMFWGCGKLETLDLSNFTTANVTDMSYMFTDCSMLFKLDLRSFSTSKVTNMREMFSRCSWLMTIYAGRGWSTAAVSTSADMFTGCTSLVGSAGTVYDASHVDATYARIDGGASSPGYLSTGQEEAYAVYEDGMLTFYYDAAKEWRTGKAYLLNASELWYNDGNNANVTTVTFDPTFAEARPTYTTSWFREMSKLTTINGLEYLNTEKVTVMAQMFCGCSSLTELDLSRFNTGRVTTMAYMFFDCSSLESLDLSNFNTVEVTDMTGMFQNCSTLKSLDLTSFNTAKVTRMSQMFSGCRNLATIYASSSWSMENVTQSVYMFSGCSSLVGGAGFAYSPFYVDGTYARIDDSESEPRGFFTADPRIYYDFYVGGIQVTNTNMADILGDGTASYDAESNTLKLNGANISVDQPGDSGNGIYSTIDHLTIEVTGENTVQSLQWHAVRNDANHLTVTGTGSLLLRGLGKNSMGIFAGTVDPGTLNISGGVKLKVESLLYGLCGAQYGGGKTYVQLVVSGSDTEIQADAPMGGVFSFLEMTLNDGLGIALPEGGTFIPSRRAVCDADGEVAESVWIRKLANRYDLNKDGAVDVSDVTLLVGYVLSPDGTHDDDYDLNGDTGVDIGDVTELVSAVLAQ